MKMKKIALLSLILIPAVVLASSGEAETTRYFAQTGRETDYWPRVVNFTIFAALMYYLLAGPLKKFFKDRKEGIASSLREIEEKLQAAKDEKKEAQARKLKLQYSGLIQVQIKKRNVTYKETV